MKEAMARRISFASLLFLLGSVAFVYGLAVARFQLWPYHIVEAAYSVAKSLQEHGAIIPEGRRIEAPSYAARERFVVRDPKQLNDGYYAFVVWDDSHEAYSAWLLDTKGHIVHRWNLEYSRLDSDGPSNGADDPHGFFAMPDGSVVVSFDKGDVMARLDACSRPLWIKPGVFHHSIDIADDGTLWAWRGDHTVYAQYQYLTNFDPETGETLREIGLVEDILAQLGSSSAILGVRAAYPFQRFAGDPPDERSVDLFHPNDIQPLRSGVAEAFPEFDAGDLAISLRSSNLIAVIDPDDATVKWWSNGPWVAQHDPDFTSDGKISVFDNNPGRGRSEILKIDPETREIANDLFGGDAVFYSSTMGKHQYLPNGNVLIVIPGEGRVIEVNKHGDVVMEFNNVSDDSVLFNEHVANGVWLPTDYFKPFPHCPT